MTAEQLEALLLRVRDDAQAAVTDFGEESITEGDQHDAKIADQRAVWHAAELALGVLRQGYVPKREALDDAAGLVERYGEGA